MKKKNLFYCLLIIFIILAALISIILGVNSHKSKTSIIVGFYDSSESIDTSLSSLISSYCDTIDLEAKFYIFNSDSDISKQIKKNKIDLIIAPAGYAVKKAANLADEGCAYPSEKLSEMFSSMQQSIIVKDGKNKALPLIFDNFEINIEKSAFYMSGMPSIATWEDIERFSSIQKNKIDYPISFAGADYNCLLDLLGALGEAFEGEAAYTKAADILSLQASLSTFDAKEVADKLFIVPDAPLAYSLYYLRKLVEKGYVTPASQYLRHSDINSYIQQRVTNLFFTKLSVHRTYDVKAIDRYSSIFVPSKTIPENRHFTATITYAVPVNSKNKNINPLIEYLLSTKVQGELSEMTGLAPVLANCPTPDQQSDDARYWVAATSTPLAGLSHEAELTDTQKEALRDAILGLIF